MNFLLGQQAIIRLDEVSIRSRNSCSELFLNLFTNFEFYLFSLKILIIVEFC